jgi:hypothetical protein
VGAPYLALCWRDVGMNYSRTGSSQAQPALSPQHSLIPTSGQNRARYGAPAVEILITESGTRRIGNAAEGSPRNRSRSGGRRSSES